MKEIIKGVINHHFKAETPEAKKRWDICMKCEHKKDDNVFGFRCNKCGCILKYKVNSDSTCPVGKW